MVTDINEHHSPKELLEHRSHPAEIVFTGFFLLVAVLLLSHIDDQSKFFAGKRFVDQPGFWPAVSLGGMVMFGVLSVVFSWKNLTSRQGLLISTEIAIWVKSLEYPGWFLVYVVLVPYVGYLPSTMLFCLVLAWRLGYNSKQAMLWAILSACLIVLLFKTFLQVKIPGGEIYNLLPATFRNFMIIYF